LVRLEGVDGDAVPEREPGRVEQVVGLDLGASAERGERLSALEHADIGSVTRDACSDDETRDGAI
jgi:hypothetical protein